MNDILNERALWLAVLIQTTADFVGIKRENVHRRAAREWFQGDGDEVGRFVWRARCWGLTKAIIDAGCTRLHERTRRS